MNRTLEDIWDALASVPTLSMPWLFIVVLYLPPLLPQRWYFL